MNSIITKDLGGDAESYHNDLRVTVCMGGEW